MKIVVDASGLRPPSPRLESHLQRSRQNFVVLTDFASMESMKGDGEVNLPRSLEILRHYPQQVIVLRSTEHIMRLRPRSKGVLGRLIDPEQTAGFSQWCHQIFVERHSNPWIGFDLRQKSKAANVYFEYALKGTQKVRTGIELMLKNYTTEDLRSLRKREPISDALHERVVRDIMHTTAIVFRDSSNQAMPAAADALWSYQFRYALCAYLLVLKWFGDGGHDSVPDARLRNDFMDMTYAAYATYFDGLLTNDQKMRDIHHAAVWALRNVFVA